MKYYLYNPLANNGILPGLSPEELQQNGAKSVDATKTDYAAFFAGLAPEDEVVLVGGDGTINYLINHVDCEKLQNKVYLFGNGSGNDFLNDIGEKPGKEILLNKYLKNLPTARVNGRSWKFINNMSYGIDGYCCEVADKIKAKTPGKKINYTSIAIKGVLYDYKPGDAVVTVDGVTREFHNIWLAPAMKGRYCGGGMMLAPGQDRFSDKLTVMIYCSRSRLQTLIAFPKIFEGKHVEMTDRVTVIKGNKVHVKFTRPCAAQIDGETVLNVMEYEAEL